MIELQVIHLLYFRLQQFATNTLLVCYLRGGGVGVIIAEAQFTIERGGLGKLGSDK